MSATNRFAIFLDGAFVLKKYEEICGVFPTVSDIINVCNRVRSAGPLKDLELLRIYYYDAKPSTDKLSNPIDGSTLDLGGTSIFVRHTSLLDSLELQPDFALRLGETSTSGWNLGRSAMKSLFKKPRHIEARDLVPNVSQKGVDLRIGLDIARVALTRSVGSIVAVTGDSDLVPAFKFARREGVRVYLDSMTHGVKRELKAHCDQELSVCAPKHKKKRRRKAKKKV